MPAQIFGASPSLIERYSYAAVRGVARFSFGEIQTATNVSWVLVEVLPTPPNEARPGNPLQDSIEGRLRILGTLAGNPPSTNMEYQWWMKRPGASMSGRIDLGGYYPPFFRTNIVVCQINQPFTGPERYKPAYIVLADWSKFVAPAWEDYKQNRTIFDPRQARKNRAELYRFLDELNPFLVAEAARTLGAAGMLDWRTIQKPLTTNFEYKQAVLTYLLIRNTPRDKLPSVTAQLSSVMKRAQHNSQIVGILVGLQTVTMDEGTDTEYVAYRQILKAIKRRQSAFKPPSGADDYVRYLLESMMIE
jgi:hypothetical protein